MALKHLLVHMDGSERTKERLHLAVTLARKSGALVTGLFAESALLGASIVGRRSPAGMKKALAEAHALFDTVADAAGVAKEWWQIDGGEYSHVVGWTVVCCRYVDLAVFGQRDESDVHIPEDLVEQVLLDAGRPVLVVPSVGSYPDVGRRVLVAWTGSRDAARAVNDAIPLMRQAEQVTVLALQLPSIGTRGGPVPPVDIVAHLRTHGIDARYEPMTIDNEISIVDTVLNRAADASADLTVIGGYGQHGFPLLQRTHTTRDILRTMTTPVLLSH